MAVQPTGTVTFLFTDIEGSTRLLERLGPERYGEALDLHRRLLRQAFGAHGGYEVDCEGDAFFVAFSRADDAVAAAMEAQRALATAVWPEGQEIRVRMGVHTGTAVPVPPKYVGLDVHKAARIMAAGHGGQVLVSAATHQAIQGYTGAISLGEHRLKDLLQPEPIYQLEIAELPNEFPALKTLGNRPTNLPVQPNPLIGRDVEVREVLRLFREESARLVTLTGTGGTGKTRLALQAGAELLDDFGSGVFFVSLAPVHDPVLVLPAIASALGVRELPNESLSKTLVDYLGHKTMLLLLDNFEQVLDATGDVAALLSGCQTLQMMVTSRERLRLSNERVYAVSPLALPKTDDAAEVARNDSVRLFVASARSAAGEFDLDASNGPAVAAICRVLDGLPLAIELAAARVATLPPGALLRRLDRRLPILTGGARDADERHRTLEAAISWSYDLLEPDEQELFRRLAVFVDGCRLDGAVAMAAAESNELDVIPYVVSLVEKNLLRQRLDHDQEPRYWMLETIREYGLAQLASAAAEEGAGRMHAEYILELARAARPQLVGSDQRAWFQRLDSDLGNIRSALEYFGGLEDATSALELLHATGLYWETRGRVREALAVIDTVLGGGVHVDAAMRARALYTASRLADAAGDLALALRYIDEAVPLAREAGDEWVLSFSLSMLGVLHGRRGASDGRPYLEEALAIAHRASNKEALAGALNNLGVIATEAGELEQAIVYCGQALELRRTIGHTRQVANSLHNMGFLYMRQRRYEEAQPLLRESVELSEALGDDAYTAAAMTELAWCAFFEGDLDSAHRTFGDVLRLGHAAGARRVVLEALIGISGGYLCRQRRAEAEAVLAVVAPLEEPLFGGASLINDYLGPYLEKAGLIVARERQDAQLRDLDDLAEALLEEPAPARNTAAFSVD